jgi:hypothetical protein
MVLLARRNGLRNLDGALSISAGAAEALGPNFMLRCGKRTFTGIIAEIEIIY